MANSWRGGAIFYCGRGSLNSYGYGPEWRGTPRPGNDDTALPQTRPEGGAVALVDEEMVRGMVSDMIRQELQGALGERITRNVRKLVRREIHRMAMSKDYE